MSKRLLLASTVLALTFAALPAFADDPVVARVNGHDIHRSDVEREVKLLGPQAQQVPLAMIYPQVLDHMIATRVVADEGYKAKLQNDEEVKDKMKDAEMQIVAETYVHKTIAPKITDAKIKAKYDEYASKYKPVDEVRARHILVKTEDEANDVIKQLKGGADFAKLATDKSIDKQSAKQGGDLGYFPHDAMVKEFADAAFAMKPGDVSQTPIKTEFGYHVIKVEDKRKSSAPPLDDVKQQIVAKLSQEETDALLKKLESSADVKKFNIDGTPMKASDSAPPAPAVK